MYSHIQYGESASLINMSKLNNSTEDPAGPPQLLDHLCDRGGHEELPAPGGRRAQRLRPRPDLLHTQL